MRLLLLLFTDWQIDSGAETPSIWCLLQTQAYHRWSQQPSEVSSKFCSGLQNFAHFISLSLSLWNILSLSLSESLSLSLSFWISLSLSLSVWNILSLSLSLSIYSDSEEAPVMSPLLGNVCFASSQFGFAFTLYSFSLIYSESFGGFSAHDFSKRLWGDIFFNKTTSVLFLSTLLYSHNYAPIQTNFTDQLFVFSYLA